MATPNDPTFGSSFTSQAEAKVRAALKSTMQMAAPNSVDERVTFVWPEVSIVNNPNAAGRPFDFNAENELVNSDKHEDVQVDCAVEFVERATYGTAIGQFENPRVVITMLDEDFIQVEGASKVLLGGNTYTWNFTEPPNAIFKIGVYRLHCTADDEGR